ncbi:MAG: TetR/AcrR family transcriptional regulator [Leucobacter sp.]|uniref:TetR/AcrR family transcriptional regulator n=1 Tax=Agrococcus casei TaxID=343512 RepID=UPI000B3597D6|nr:helix-turn-helix domain-containing protein [Agrococcus casei]
MTKRQRSLGRPRVTDRASILKAVIADGLDRFTVTSVAQRLGITHGTIYRYFGSREELVVSAVNAVVAGRSWSTKNDSWRQMLGSFAHELWRTCDSAPGFARSVLELPETPEGITAVISEYVRSLTLQGFTTAQAQVIIDLVGEQVLLTASMLIRRDGKQIVVPVIDDEASMTGVELDWARGIGWLDRKLALVFDGAEHQLNLP